MGRSESKMVDEFEKVADVSEVPQGTTKIVNLAGQEIAIANVEGKFYAFPNKCTHMGGPVGEGKLTGFVIQCPWHGSQFDVRTGAVVRPPAQRPLKPSS
jgi:glycine betaine catabolism B